MNGIMIREALESDIDILLGFEQGIVEAERPFGDRLKEGEIHYYDLMDLIRSDRTVVLVAVFDDEIVGSGYARIEKAKPFLQFDAYAYLGFMYVKPEYRGQGVNKRILEELVLWAKGRGLSEVRLEVYDENEIARAAFARFGFKPNLLVMRREI